MSKPKVSTETQQVLDEFDAADAEFQQAWALFEERHGSELDQLERLREKRNSILDDATRALRTEADEGKEKILKVGSFTATKKESHQFHLDMVLARLHERNLYDAAKKAKAVEEIITVPYKPMKKFLDDMGVYPDFEDCEDSKPLTTAVSGPKAISAFAAEMKK